MFSPLWPRAATTSWHSNSMDHFLLCNECVLWHANYSFLLKLKFISWSMCPSSSIMFLLRQRLVLIYPPSVLTHLFQFCLCWCWIAPCIWWVVQLCHASWSNGTWHQTFHPGKMNKIFVSAFRSPQLGVKLLLKGEGMSQRSSLL